MLTKKPLKEKFPFLIGTDPEFNVFLQDKRICAETLMKNLFKNKKPYKSEEMGYMVKGHGEIGWDGAGATGELRPNPTNDPKILTNHMGKILEAFIKETKLFSLSTSSLKAPIGGHIHFDLPKETTQTKLQVIHKKLSSFAIPLMMGENIINLRMRLKQHYGTISDGEIKTIKGGIKTYEYRVPSAEWLTTPKITYATIIYLATIYNEILNHSKKLEKTCKDILYSSEKQGKALQELAVTKFTSLTNIIISQTKKHIKTFEYYPQYQKEIDYILTPNKVLKDKRNVEYDIVQGWKLHDNIDPTKKELLNEKKVQKESLKINLDSLTELININYNTDTNVEQFIRAIKQRILALNWKLKNTYYFFGLRKGIQDYIVINLNEMWLKGTEQIKTTRDIDVISETFERMRSKLITSDILNITNKKDLEAVKIKQNIIGIPYHTRIKLNIRSLIELIYEIEKGKLQEINTHNLYKKMFNDSSSKIPKKKLGKIFTLYKKTNTENPADFIVEDEN